MTVKGKGTTHSNSLERGDVANKSDGCVLNGVLKWMKFTQCKGDKQRKNVVTKTPGEN